MKLKSLKLTLKIILFTHGLVEIDLSASKHLIILLALNYTLKISIELLFVVILELYTVF